MALCATLAGCAAPDGVTGPLDRSASPRASEASHRASKPTTRSKPCPPIPSEIRRLAAASRLPGRDRSRLTGDALVANLDKTRALRELIALYDRCRF